MPLSDERLAEIRWRQERTRRDHAISDRSELLAAYDELRAEVERLREDAKDQRSRAVAAEVRADEQRAEVERLRASLGEVKRRLTNTGWSTDADDRIRVALLHIEAVEDGRAALASADEVQDAG